MKALILIGGFGTRLEPLTLTTPKAMVPVLNIPFLEMLIERLKHYGIGEVVLSMGHLHDSILAYFNNGSRFGIRIYYAVEDRPLGTGGGIKNAASYLDDTFLVINGDVFTDIDIEQMYTFHQARHALSTIALIPVTDPPQYGVIEPNPEGRVLKFLEKPSPQMITSNMINAGLIIMEPHILDYIPANQKYSYERDLFPALLEAGQAIFGYASSAYWIDIGTPQKYFQLHDDLVTGKSNQGLTSTPIVIDQHTTVGSDAKLNGTVVIGPNCCIGSGAQISNSIIWQGVSIGEHSIIDSAIIANDCIIGDSCRIHKTIIGSNVKLAKGLKFSEGSRIYPRSVLF
jgi:mannose-1-phosphate guanylyltransferase